MSEADWSASSRLPWGKIVGTRHILVHAYYNIDFDAVWRVVQDLPEMVRALEEVVVGLPGDSQ